MTALLADWSVGAPTIALAGATSLLAFLTYLAVRKASQQLDIERARIEASQRPYVFPISSADWADRRDRYGMAWGTGYVPAKNGGLGPALNVRGHIFFRGIVGTILRTGLTPSDSADLRIDSSSSLADLVWDGATGYLLYEDVTGLEWRTEFGIRENSSTSRREIEILRVAANESLPPLDEQYPLLKTLWRV